MRFPNLNTSLVARIREYIHHLANGGDMLASLFLSMLGHRVISGGIVANPTTPSTQATLVGGATVIRANVSYAYLAGDGNYYESALAADVVAGGTAASFPAGISGQSLITTYGVYRRTDTGALVVFGLKGVGAPTGTQVAPSDAAITTYVATLTAGTGATWWKLAEVTNVRSSDIVLNNVAGNLVNDNSKGDRGVWLANF